MRSALRMILAILVAALVASACGSDSDSETSSSSTTTESTETTTSTAETTTTEAAETTTTAPDAPAIPEVSALTIDELLNVEYPLVIAHAGGDQEAPHSTMFAFAEAAAAGTDVLELDVMLTQDEVLIAQHDDTVDRTTNSTGRVRDFTYDEIAELDAGYWFADTGEWSNRDLPPENYPYRGVRTGDAEAPEGYSAEDFKIETFWAVATAFPDLPLDVELKIPSGDDGEADLEWARRGAEILAEELAELGREASTVVVSFDETTLAAFRELAPNVATSPSVDAMTAWALAGGELHANDKILQLPPDFDGISVLEPPLIEKANAEGYAIWVWPNSSDQENADFYASIVTDKGLAGIIAGKPSEAVERYAAEGWR